MIIGITGGSGSGKSTLSRELAKRGFTVIDADKEYHHLQENDLELRQELIDNFGTAERAQLRNIVFADKEKASLLREVTYKHITKAIDKKLALGGDIVLDASGLFESGYDAKCDKTIAVLANREVRINRLLLRDGLTRQAILSRLQAQPSDEFYTKSADIIVNNNGNGFNIDSILGKLNQKIAIYGGTFSPPTLGHLDVIKRAVALYDKLYVVVLKNPTKDPIFTEEERLNMLKKITEDLPNVEVERYDGLLAEYAKEKGANFSVRGLRDQFDLKSEHEMYQLNAQIAKEEFEFSLDTNFSPTTLENFYTSSSMVRELFKSGSYKVASKYVDARIYDDIFNKYRAINLEKNNAQSSAAISRIAPQTP
ncbi:MAG: pantetheine-phosphate adenylyltransferase [Clostridiales bacterium]|jgi:pantetheine-phosphate adenylyltransferase|nr:pantetheine-phosphate adenylyltransferase [Clostridiales bacterium]